MCLGVPAKVVRIEGTDAIVALGDVEYRASLLLLPDVREEDFIILHAGFAIEKIDEAEAEETMRLLRAIEMNDPETFPL